MCDEFAPAISKIGEEVAFARGGCFDSAHRSHQGGGDEKGRGIDRERPARVRRRHDHAGEHGAEDQRRVRAQADQRVRLLQSIFRDRERDERGVRRVEESERGAVDGLEDHEVPDFSLTREQQDRGERLRAPADEVAADQHRAAGKAIGDHAANCQEEDVGQHAGRKHEAERRRRSGEVEHGERERHRGHRVAEERNAAPGEQQPEVSPAQEGGGAVHRGSIAGAPWCVAPTALTALTATRGWWRGWFRTESNRR